MLAEACPMPASKGRGRLKPRRPWPAAGPASAIPPRAACWPPREPQDSSGARRSRARRPRTVAAAAAGRQPPDGGRPVWRPESGLVEVTDRGSPVPATLGGGTSTRAGPGLEVAGAACGRARSRPLPPGGVSSEFTAYAPTSTPPWPLPPAFNSGSDQFRYRPHAPAGICTLDLCRSAIGPSAHSTTEPAHIMREYGQR